MSTTTLAFPDDDDPLDGLRPGHEAKGEPGKDSADAAARRATAVRLRIAGATYEQIAEECGYTDRSTARHVVMRSLDRIEAARVGELRELENARLDRAQAAIWTQVTRGDLKAVDTYVRLSARRARMNGLDAPQQIAISTGAQAALHDALADLRTVVLGEVIDVVEEEPDDDDDET